MGLGGELLWTAVARELVESGFADRMMPVHTTFNGQFRQEESTIFANNPHCIQVEHPMHLEDLLAEGYKIRPLVLNDPRTNYCKNDTPDKAVHRFDRHVIEQICEFYGIMKPALKCVLVPTVHESKHADEIISKLNIPSEFIVIEPNVKNEYGINKEYPFEKWQKIVNEIAPDMRIVQVGGKQSRVLDGVIDATGLTTFREAAEIIRRSRLLVASEGGLMHAANAVGTKAVIAITGFIHPRMTCYPENANVWIGHAHGPCGMKIKCDICDAEVKAHDYHEILNSITEKLS